MGTELPLITNDQREKMTLSPEDALARSYSWKMAEELVTPIIEKHGLEMYKVNQAPFVSGHTVTAVDQHIDQIMRVANWLLGKE